MDTNSVLSSEVLPRLALGTEAFLLLCLAFMIRALFNHRSYQAQKEALTSADNVATAIDLSAYLFSILLVMLDSLVLKNESLLGQSSELAYIGITIIILMEVCQRVSDLILFKGITVHHEIHQKHNLALALARGSVIIAIAMMLRGVLEQEQSWVDHLIWSGVGITSITGLGAFLQWLTPYDDLEEISKGNMAASLPLCGAWLASGITVEAAISGESISFVESIIGILLFIVIACIVICILRFALRHIFFRGVDLDKEIVEDRNSGVGLFEATLYLCIAELISFFLS